MRNESVAILDIRSYEIVFFLGSKGVNDTFVFSGSHTVKYDGFSSAGFFDLENFRKAVVEVVTSVRQNYEASSGKFTLAYLLRLSPYVPRDIRSRSRLSVKFPRRILTRCLKAA